MTKNYNDSFIVIKKIDMYTYINYINVYVGQDVQDLKISFTSERNMYNNTFCSKQYAGFKEEKQNCLYNQATTLLGPIKLIESNILKKLFVHLCS